MTARSAPASLPCSVASSRFSQELAPWGRHTRTVPPVLGDRLLLAGLGLPVWALEVACPGKAFHFKWPSPKAIPIQVSQASRGMELGSWAPGPARSPAGLTSDDTGWVTSFRPGAEIEQTVPISSCGEPGASKSAPASLQTRSEGHGKFHSTAPALLGGPCGCPCPSSASCCPQAKGQSLEGRGLEALTSEVLIQWGGGRVGARARSCTLLRELDTDSPASLCPSQGWGAGPEPPPHLGLGHRLPASSHQRSADGHRTWHRVSAATSWSPTRCALGTRALEHAGHWGTARLGALLAGPTSLESKRGGCRSQVVSRGLSR